ncbi:type IX secretion system membrane protein PorP/SprF [Marivirga sp. S37H4]|uniref:Type IX secretion system membrane protein PorP/SprF n=1 Tax=Marivirga aurantiaca TaxID=2802615 RepID=A0A934WZ32_9BACT|nr:type IX secretion system membrane protein PorP/SprF [Marivirga aurantiaca]MBK6265853.1 type IX secretion system membrane protein PorP/SprF [Marivirga aurantiaca]
MKHLILKIMFFSVLFAVGSAKAQNTSFSHYMFNNLYNNPAYSGVEGYTKLTALHRTQWLGYSPTVGPGGALNTQLISITSPINRINSGFGFFIVNDQIQASNFVQVQASGAYHLGIKDSKLSIGFRAGAITQTVNKDIYIAINPDDEVIENIEPTQVRPDFSLGLHFQHENFYVGASFNHMIETEFGFGSDPYRNPYPKDLILTGGYTFPLTYDISVTPSLLLRSTEFTSYTFDISTIATYKDKIWGGVSFRQQESAILMLGYSFFKENTLRFGYAFDYTVVARDAKGATSHEVMLSYRLPAISTSGKKVVRTPRFRH